MRKSAVNQLILYFQDAFQKAEVQVQRSEIEALATLIYSCMVGGRRMFHTPEHILLVSRKLDQAPQIFAALFHDIIYYQVDDGLPPLLRDTLLPYLESSVDGLKIKSHIPEENTLAHICLEIFQFQPGQTLPLYNGLNEFLSALVAVHKLKAYLPFKDLLAMIICVEGTIPFRKRDQEGRTRFEALEARVQDINESRNLELTQDEIETWIKSAVFLANQDVENFSDKDVGRFLDNTWKLIPETNGAVKKANVFSLTNYREALRKTKKFLESLDGNYVFHQYKDFPDDETYEHISKQAARNLEVACEYMKAKILSIGIIEALALQTGGDAPISMFIGDLRDARASQDVERAEDYLPAVHQEPHLHYDADVLKLLEFGRASHLSFDMQNAPISYYVYASLGGEKMEAYSQLAEQMFDQKLSCADFLAKIDHEVVSAIAHACAEVAITRREALEKFF